MATLVGQGSWEGPGGGLGRPQAAVGTTLGGASRAFRRRLAGEGVRHPRRSGKVVK